MGMHLITLALAAATLAAFLTIDGPKIAFMPRKLALAVAAVLIALSAGLVAKDIAWRQVVPVVALAGLFVLTLCYPQIQKSRGQPVKKSVVLTLVLCVVFGTSLYLAESQESPHGPGVPAASTSSPKALS